MVRISLAVAAALLVAACGGSEDGRSNKYAADGFAAPAPAMAPPPPPAAMMERASRVAIVSQEALGGAQNRPDIIQQDPNNGGGPPPGTMMAYTYGWAFSVPGDRLESLLNVHKKACEDAGPAKCYVVNSGVSGLAGEEGSNGYLALRASEAWVRTFEAGVESGLKPFDAEVDQSSRSGEDLTVQIVDGEARLKSITAFRDGLQQMLRDKPGRLSDLLEIQKTLADTQADIDSRQSVLAAMKLRVAMSTLNFNYQPKASAVARSVWKPLGDAFGNFVPNFAYALAGIIEFIGGILPVVIFGGLALWAVVSLWRWRRKRRKPKAGPLTPKPVGTAGTT